MLDLQFIRQNKQKVQENCKNRLVEVDIESLLELDLKKRETETKLDALRATRNTTSKTKPSSEEIIKMKKIGDEIQKLESELKLAFEKIWQIWITVPNMTHPEVKVSADEDEVVVLERCGEPTKFDFKAKDHIVLSEKLDLIDFERGTKVAGAKFYYFKNQLAILDLSLTRFAFDMAVKHGYTPFITPDIAKREIVESMGYNPRGESTQIYNIEKTDLSLIGTSEITMGGYHKDEILKEKDLPKKYVAYSHCFRTEAGSYSKFAKGIFRVHQFSKVEMFQFTTPEKSEDAHKELLEIEKEIYTSLGIPFRVVDHTTSDLGTPAYRTFDLEAWLPGKPNKEGGLGDWAEITSTSNCTDYQSRGLNIKYLDKSGNKKFVHMLNGTAIVMTRPIIAILENFQQKDGSIKMPEVLVPYLGFGEIKIRKEKV